MCVQSFGFTHTFTIVTTFVCRDPMAVDHCFHWFALALNVLFLGLNLQFSFECDMMVLMAVSLVVRH